MPLHMMHIAHIMQFIPLLFQIWFLTAGSLLSKIIIKTHGNFLCSSCYPERIRLSRLFKNLNG